MYCRKMLFLIYINISLVFICKFSHLFNAKLKPQQILQKKKKSVDNILSKNPKGMLKESIMEACFRH